MADTNNGISIDVAVDEAGNGDRVRVAFGNGTEQVLYLTPQQARAFASELIQTVYKAEVKTSLQRNRRQASPASERVVQGAFPGSRIAGA
jgi:hypothetical protein